MGSPLAQILTNWFVTSKWNFQIQTNWKEKPLFYTRYVDDIFVVTKNESELTNFYHEMNFLHPNLEFTLKRPVDGKLPFVYTEVKQI